MKTDPRAEPIIVLEEGRTLSFVYDDLLRFHGGAMPAGVALACRLMQAVFRLHRRRGGGLPERGDCAFHSGLGENGRGIIDAVDCALRLRRHGLLLAAPRIPAPEDAPKAPGGGSYAFEFTIGEAVYPAILRDGLIPKEFFELSRQRHDAAKGLAVFTGSDRARLMKMRTHLAEALMRAEGEALFRIAAG